MLQIKNIVAQADADSGDEEVGDDGEDGINSEEPEPDFNSNYEDGEVTINVTEDGDDSGDKEYDSQDTVRQDEASQVEDIEDSRPGKRKFGNIKFKQGLKTKGRPKKRLKQFTFNKSAADRKSGSSKKKKKAPFVPGSSDDDDEDETFDDDGNSDEDITSDHNSREEEDTSSDEQEVFFKNI